MLLLLHNGLDTCFFLGLTDMQTRFYLIAGIIAFSFDFVGSTVHRILFDDFDVFLTNIIQRQCETIADQIITLFQLDSQHHFTIGIDAHLMADTLVVLYGQGYISIKEECQVSFLKIGGQIVVRFPITHINRIGGHGDGQIESARVNCIITLQNRLFQNTIFVVSYDVFCLCLRNCACAKLLSYLRNGQIVPIIIKIRIRGHLVRLGLFCLVDGKCRCCSYITTRDRCGVVARVDAVGVRHRFALADLCGGVGNILRRPEDRVRAFQHRRMPALIVHRILCSKLCRCAELTGIAGSGDGIPGIIDFVCAASGMVTLSPLGNKEQNIRIRSRQLAYRCFFTIERIAPFPAGKHIPGIDEPVLRQINLLGILAGHRRDLTAPCAVRSHTWIKANDIAVDLPDSIERQVADLHLVGYRVWRLFLAIEGKGRIGDIPTGAITRFCLGIRVPSVELVAGMGVQTCQNGMGLTTENIECRLGAVRVSVGIFEILMVADLDLIFRNTVILVLIALLFQVNGDVIGKERVFHGAVDVQLTTLNMDRTLDLQIAVPVIAWSCVRAVGIDRVVICRRDSDISAFHHQISTQLLVILNGVNILTYTVALIFRAEDVQVGTTAGRCLNVERAAADICAVILNYGAIVLAVGIANATIFMGESIQAVTEFIEMLFVDTDLNRDMTLRKSANAHCAATARRAVAGQGSAEHLDRYVSPFRCGNI